MFTSFHPYRTLDLVGGEGKNETKRQLVETDKKVDETTKKFKMGESLVRQEAEGICCVISVLHEKSWVFTSCCYDGSAGI